MHPECRGPCCPVTWHGTTCQGTWLPAPKSHWCVLPHSDTTKDTAHIHEREGEETRVTGPGFPESSRSAETCCCRPAATPVSGKCFHQTL